MKNLYLGCVPELSESGGAACAICNRQSYVADTLGNGKTVGHYTGKTFIRKFGSIDITPRNSVTAYADNHLYGMIVCAVSSVHIEAEKTLYRFFQSNINPMKIAFDTIMIVGVPKCCTIVVYKRPNIGTFDIVTEWCT